MSRLKQAIENRGRGIVNLVREEKEIQSIEMDRMCLLTNPCQHYVKINYVDGTSFQNGYTAGDIVKKFWKFLNGTEREHFSYLFNSDKTDPQFLLKREDFL